MNKRLIILENEKEYIKGLYGLLNEAPPTPTAKNGNIIIDGEKFGNYGLVG